MHTGEFPPRIKIAPSWNGFFLGKCRDVSSFFIPRFSLFHCVHCSTVNHSPIFLNTHQFRNFGMKCTSVFASLRACRFTHQKMNKKLKTKIFNYICLTRLTITSTALAQVSVFPVPGKKNEKCAKRKNVENCFRGLYYIFHKVLLR